MRILITGISGRIGANLAARLVREGHDVRGLIWPRDLRTEKVANLGVELISGSVTETEDARKAADGMDAIYHLAAAFQGGGPFTEEEYFEINVRGTFNMLEAARHVDRLEHFCYAGTDAVYRKYIPGGIPDPINETMFVEPKGDYALTKSLGEDLCLGYWRGHGLPVTVTRFANVLGAGEILKFTQFFLSRMKGNSHLSSLWAGEERLIILRDENGRPYKKHVADVRDIVDGCFAVLGKSAALGQIIQLAAPEAFTWDVAIPHLSAALGIPYVEADVPGTPTFYEFDLTRSRTLLQFEPEYHIIRMIDDAVRFDRGEDIGLLET